MRAQDKTGGSKYSKSKASKSMVNRELVDLSLLDACQYVSLERKRKFCETKL